MPHENPIAEVAPDPLTAGLALVTKISAERNEALRAVNRLLETRADLIVALRNITECAEAGADGANMDLWIMQSRAAIAKAEAR